MRADNRGEGGTMALIALASAAVRKRPQWRVFILSVGLFGASLFFGEAVLTPAISVVSAVEGLEVGTSAFKPWVLPLAALVLLALFMFQRQGTAVVGALFGPVCMLWFIALGAVGVWQIAQNPVVLAAVDPRHAFHFLTSHGFPSFVVMGAVLLAFTGAEALYADMGHFGEWPIRAAWFGLVLPALVLNYFGQGALLIANPKALDNPFYHAFPGWALYPMVGLATAAAHHRIAGDDHGRVLARAAGDSAGLPAAREHHPYLGAPERAGLHPGEVNWVLFILVLAAVLGCGSSSSSGRRVRRGQSPAP